MWKISEIQRLSQVSLGSVLSRQHSIADGPGTLPAVEPRYRFWLGLLLVFLLAAFLRLDNLGTWLAQPAKYFVDEQPLLLNVDGYYYLDLARDLVNDTYATVDPDRTVPYSRPRPAPVPLLSIVTSVTHQLTGFSLSWIAIILPAILGALIVFPVYGLGCQLGGRVMGFTAAVFAGASPHYVQRTTLGWFDTDGLVVVLPLAIAWAVMRFAESRDQRRLGFLALAVVFEILFLWWWDFGTAPVLAALLTPMTVAIALYPLGKRFRINLIVGILIGVGLISVFKPNTLASFLGQFEYLYEVEETTFPSSGGNVVEQRGTDFNTLARETMNGWPGFILALAGFLLLALRQRKRVLFLAFPFIVGCLSLTAARFMIFLAPIVGLGVGMLVQSIWNLKSRVSWAIPVAILAFVLPTWQIAAEHKRDNNLPPLRLPYQVTAMKKIKTVAPEDSAIWADWSHGYPILYHSDRGTFADGAFHSGRMLFVLSLPLATDNPRFAANWIRFFPRRGNEGLDEINRRIDGDWDKTIHFFRQVFSAGPRDSIALLKKFGVTSGRSQAQWLEYLFPSERRPVYVFLDYDKIRTPWLRFGLWNFAEGRGPQFAHEPIIGLRREGDLILNNRFELNTSTGIVKYNNSDIPIRQLLVHGRGVRQMHKRGFTFEYFEKEGWGMLMDDNVLPSVGRKLFSKRLNNSPWFKPVIDSLPYYGLWKVNPDNLATSFNQAAAKNNGQ